MMIYQTAHSDPALRWQWWIQNFIMGADGRRGAKDAEGWGV